MKVYRLVPEEFELDEEKVFKNLITQIDVYGNEIAFMRKVPDKQGIITRAGTIPVFKGFDKEDIKDPVKFWDKYKYKIKGIWYSGRVFIEEETEGIYD
jgi:hypothetical protein